MSSLEIMIEDFLKEKVGLGLLSIADAGAHHVFLVESPIPLQHLGFVLFLKNRGLARPKCSDLTEFWIGEYHEFLLQHFGELTKQAAMESLKALWNWASQNNYIRNKKEPGFFQDDKATTSFRVSLKIEPPRAKKKRS